MFDDIGRNFLMNPQNGLKVFSITTRFLPGPLPHLGHDLLKIMLYTLIDSTLHEGPPQQGEGQGAV